MTPEPTIRQRALLPGVSASAWSNLLAITVMGFILALLLLGASGQPWAAQIPLARPLAVLFGAADVIALVTSGTMVFVRLSAERAQGYTTIDGFRIGRGVSLVPGAPDVVDTVESRTGVVLRDAGDVDAAPELIAARLAVAKSRIRAGARPILLDPR
jgi:hypothetical protein